MTETTSLIDWIITGGIILAKILIIVVPLMLCVAYLTYAERKVIGYMQLRLGPNRVGPKGFFQPFADVLKLLVKEVVVALDTEPVKYAPIPPDQVMSRFRNDSPLPYQGR